MSFTHCNSQSENYTLLENHCIHEDYEKNRKNSYKIKCNRDIINVNKHCRIIQKLSNKKKYFNLTSDYAPMNSNNNESVNNTINNDEITIIYDGIEVPEIVNSGLVGKFFPFGFCYEFKKLVQLAIPITITSLVAFLSGPMGLIFCGQLGKTALATVGLANSIFNVAGLAVVTGLLTAVDTLFSQTYGSLNKGLMGIHLQRAIVIMFVMCMPSWSLYLCIEPILLALKQNPLISKEASEYLLFMIPGLYFAALGQILTKYVQTQNRVYIPLIIGILTNCFNALMHYFLLFVIKIGIIGSAISQSSAYLFQCICFLPYIMMLQKSGLTWKGWTNELWLDWGNWFKLAMPGVLMITLEWSIFEVGSIISGTLGERELATQTILFNIESICFTLLPLGFGIASSIRVGQFLGARSSVGPRSVISVALVTLWTTSIAFILMLILMRWKIPKIFTSEQDVIELSAKLLPLIATFQIFDGTVGVCSGAIRGAGLQLFGAFICFVTLYLISSPISLSLVFFGGYGLEGLWAGMTVGTIFEGVVYLVTCQSINWEKQVQLAIERTEQLMLMDDQLLERSINQTTVDAQHSVDIKPSSMNDKHVNETEETDIQNTIPPDEYAAEVSPSLVNDYDSPSIELNSGSRKKISTQLKNVMLSRITFTLFMLCILILGIILRVYKPWSGKFGIYCTFSNGTFISFKNQSAILFANTSQTILNPDSFLFREYSQNCTIYFP